MLFGLAACTPAQPPPQPGAATLSEDILPYDHPEFLTNRPPVLQPLKECERVTTDVLAKLGLKLASTPYQDRKEHTGCTVTLRDAEIKIATSPAQFSDYWRGEAYGQGIPGARDQLHTKPPDSFSRRILAGKYYAVVFSTNAGTAQAECHAVVDTGSAQPFVVTSNPYTDDPTRALFGPHPSVDELKRTFCPASTNVATKLLAQLDPRGGSRAQ